MDRAMSFRLSPGRGSAAAALGSSASIPRRAAPQLLAHARHAWLGHGALARRDVILRHHHHRRSIQAAAQEEGKSAASKASRKSKSGNAAAADGPKRDASDTSSSMSASVGVDTSLAAPPAPSYPGTPLFWVGVGVALSVAVNWVVKKLYQQAQQAMMRQLMEAMKAGAPPGAPGGSPFGGPSPFGAGMGGMGGMPPGFPPSPFPPPPFPQTAGGVPGGGMGGPFSQQSSTSEGRGQAAVDTTASVAETNGSATPSVFSDPKQPATPASANSASSSSASRGASGSSEDGTPIATPSSVIEPDENPRPRKSSFFQDTDVNAESSCTGAPFTGGYSWNTNTNTNTNTSANTSSSSSAAGGAGGKGKMTVEVLEKMLEDPTIQKMILPYLPEEMRDPATFKWMLQSPLYRSQLEQMMEGGASQGFDPQVLEMMQRFDLNSPKVQAQFSQMGMTPEQVVSKVMGDPQLAAAFQNPRIQAALLDVSTNPYNLAKYANDAEFMEVFQKMQQVFPVS